jgi:hypothetical protein
MTELPEPVARLLAATNAEDRIAFLDAFTEDGVVDDWGRRFVGRVRVGAGGYNGGGTFTARLRDGRISELLIRG